MQSQELPLLDVSTDDPGALAAIDHFASDLLGNGPDTARVLGAAQAHPECGLLQTYVGILHLYAMTEPENLVANEYFPLRGQCAPSEVYLSEVYLPAMKKRPFEIPIRRRSRDRTRWETGGRVSPASEWPTSTTSWRSRPSISPTTCST